MPAYPRGWKVGQDGSSGGGRWVTDSRYPTSLGRSRSFEAGHAWEFSAPPSVGLDQGPVLGCFSRASRSLFECTTLGLMGLFCYPVGAHPRV